MVSENMLKHLRGYGSQTYAGKQQSIEIDIMLTQLV
jgi:hypothetical protein